VTDNLPRRAGEHREGVVEASPNGTALKRLVYIEHHADIRAARSASRRSNISVQLEARLILVANPNWDDLCDQLA
jgi:putative endonuclease